MVKTNKPGNDTLVSEKASPSNQRAGIEKKYSQKIALQLNRAQKTIAAHRKCALALRKLHCQDTELFFQQFFVMIRPILLVFKREPNVERLIQFIIQYTSNAERISSEEEVGNRTQRRNSGLTVDSMDDVTQKFCFDMIKCLIKYAHAKDKSIRFRVCQIVAGLMDLMPDEVEIEDELCEQLLVTFVCRLKDKVPAVRQQAVCILARIHDPLNPEDEITNEYKRLMATDTNKDVRKEVVKCILPSKYTLSAIVERTRDVKDDVRRMAYEKLFTDCPFKRLSISERVSILKNGLRDRSTSVQQACVSLLAKQWLGIQVENDIIALLKALDVENYTDTAELVLTSLFSVNDADMRKHIMGRTIDIHNLSPEEALYLRMKIQYLLKDEKEDDLEEVLPNATEFCAITARHYKECQEFTTKQCLIIARHLDFCDEVGRKNIHTILKHMVMVFQSPENHITEIIEALKIVIPSESEFRTTIRECVEPLQCLASELENEANAEEEERKLHKNEINSNIKKCKTKLKRLEKDRARLESELDEAEEDDSEMIDEIREDLQKVTGRIEAVNEAILELEEDLTSADTLKKDAMVWIRALCVLREVNRVVSPQCVQKLLEESNILKTIVVPCLTKASVHVRSFAMTVLGQYCGMHLPFAQKYVNLFTNSLYDRKEDPAIHRAALAASFDMVQIHSLGKIYERCEMEEKEVCVSELIATFKQLMFEGDHSDIAVTAIEGCCKLIIFNKLQEHHVLEVVSNMIIVLFDPRTENLVQVKQCLSMFLPAFAFSSLKNMNRVAKVVLPTLFRISQMSSINLQQAGQFLIYLTDRTHLKKAPKDLNFPQPHASIAIQLAYEVLLSTGKESNTFCKLFANFNEFEDKQTIKQLHTILKMAEENIANRISAKAVEKYLEILGSQLEKTKSTRGTEDADMEQDSTENEELEQLIELEKEEHSQFRDSFMESLSNEDSLTARFFEIAGIPVEPEVVPEVVPQTTMDVETITPTKAPPTSSNITLSLEDCGPNGSSQSSSPAFAATPVKTPISTPIKTPAKYNDDDLILDDCEEMQYSPRSASIARRLSCAATQQRMLDDSDSDVEALDLDDISSDEEEDEEMPASPSGRRLTTMNRELDSLIDEVPLNDGEDDTAMSDE